MTTAIMVVATQIMVRMSTMPVTSVTSIFSLPKTEASDWVTRRTSRASSAGAASWAAAASRFSSASGALTLSSITSAPPPSFVRFSMSARDMNKKPSSLPPVLTMPETLSLPRKREPLLFAPSTASSMPGLSRAYSAASAPARTSFGACGHAPVTCHQGLVLRTAAKSVPTAV